MLLDPEKISFLHVPVLLGVDSLWMRRGGSPFHTSELKSKEALMVNGHTSRREKTMPPVGKLSDFRKKCNVATVPTSNVV